MSRQQGRCLPNKNERRRPVGPQSQFLFSTGTVLAAAIASLRLGFQATAPTAVTLALCPVTLLIIAGLRA